ncbi:TPA: hypothetical protein EYP66_02025 [Candidatus Poribacteria bacterium]|nr:hypothetical protein [Candidatus Poribacteria bacterium]
MNKKTTLLTKLFFIITFVTICISGIYARQVELFEPPRLFNVPVADTLKSFDLNASGAGTFGTDQFSFLGTGYLGLGRIAQIEVGAVRILRRLNEAETELIGVPAAGIKIFIPGERASRILPNVSASYRRTFGRYEETGSITYKRELADLYIMASKTLISFKGWRGITLHGGADYIGASLTGNKVRRETLEKFLPFGGIEIWATGKTKLMGEFEWVANFNEEGIPKLEDEPVWVAIVGARIFITRFLTADIGVRYQENFKTVADAKIEASFSVSIPTHLIYDF